MFRFNSLFLYYRLKATMKPTFDVVNLSLVTFLKHPSKETWTGMTISSLEMMQWPLEGSSSRKDNALRNNLLETVEHSTFKIKYQL